MRTRVFYLEWARFGDLGAIAPYQAAFEPMAEMYQYVATIEADTPEEAWEAMSRGSGRELALLDDQELRSMSVGDIIYQADIYLLCRPIGWYRLPFDLQLFQALYRMIPDKEVESAKPTATSSHASQHANPQGE